MSDKRTVSTDALETLGTIIGDGEKRDAIHLAVLPVAAGARLKPGQEISIEGGLAVAEKGGQGIVDPFLSKPVMPGQRFWMVIKPRVITSLRHVWSHPELPDEMSTGEVDKKATAFAELERIAEEVDCDVYTLIGGANDYLDCGDYLSEGGRWEGTYLPNDFWPAFETYTGRKVEEGSRGSFFSCSC
jgi:hypothetical protein